MNLYWSSLPDFNIISVALFVLLDVDVDREMGIDISHLVLVASRYASDKVLDDRLDSSQSSDVLSRAMMNFNLNKILAFLILWEREGDSNV